MKLHKKIDKLIDELDVDNDEKAKNNMINHYLDHYEYVMDDTKILELLDMLPQGYDDKFENYMTITTILKSHEKYELWDKWSKKNNRKYNFFRNVKLWNWCKRIYSINLLIYILRSQYEKNVEYIQYYKKYVPLTSQSFYDHKKEENCEYVSELWSYEDFTNYDIQIIQSTTGTGKTTAMASHVAKYMKENKNVKLLTLSTITTLIDQHVKTFEKVHLKSYQDLSHLEHEKAVATCINSLVKLKITEKNSQRLYFVY